MPDCEIDPEGKMTADKIIGTSTNSGSILQVVNKLKGTFTWSVWLKGTGNVKFNVFHKLLFLGLSRIDFDWRDNIKSTF